MSDVPGRDLKYNKLEYVRYSARLRVACNQHPKAAKVLCGVFKDPVTFFLTYVQGAGAGALFTDEEKPSKADIKNDPVGTLKAFVAVFLAKDSDGVLTETRKNNLQIAIVDWILGESASLPSML